jgi:two-component system, chemotaxis family, protein-glutamate methylesterase/glutaminase
MTVEKARVLIVDDSVVVRRMLTDILSMEPDIEVVGAAANASLALAKIPQTNPNLITLDVEMPGMNGLDLLAEIRKTSPKLPVIMFSSLTQRAAATTLEALARGATDYVTKPSGMGSRAEAVEHVRAQLVPKIRALAGHLSRMSSGQGACARPKQKFSAAGLLHLQVLAVGSSTGGPNALVELFRAIPRTLPVPVVIVQHMPPVFTRTLAERLTAACPMKFHEAVHGDLLRPGEAWIAPGDHHLRVERQAGALKLALSKDLPENSCRPAVDVLFRSVADVFAEGTLAVVLTGMGQDGLRGCQAIAARGGQIVVQDEATSVVWGMPGFVAKNGLAEAVLPLGELSGEVLRRVMRSGARPPESERRHAG